MISSGTPAESNGFWLDGESPLPQPLRISLLDTSLRFVSQGERKSQNWDFSQIDWEATRLLNNQLRIKHKDDDQWLVATTQTLIDDIQAERKHWSRRHFWAARPDTTIAVRAGAGAIIICAALWLTGPYLTAPLAHLVPNSTREWLGNTAQKLTGMENYCAAPEGILALNKLTARLAANRPELKNVRVIPVESTMINALTLANDKVLLTSAIIAQATSPDEIAGILAHEFGHIAHQHVIRGVISQMALKTLTSIFTGAHGSQIGYINDMTSSAHTRRFEAQADSTGIELLRAAHISSHGLGEFFHRVAKLEGVSSRFTTYFSSHPASAEREQLMMDTIIPEASPALNVQEWQAVKSVCGGSTSQKSKTTLTPPNTDTDDNSPPPATEEPAETMENTAPEDQPQNNPDTNPEMLPSPDPNEQRDL
jgi:hypothetical protein